MGEEDRILEVIARALRDRGEAKIVLTALQADGWVVVRKAPGIHHRQEPFKSE